MSEIPPCQRQFVEHRHAVSKGERKIRAWLGGPRAWPYWPSFFVFRAAARRSPPRCLDSKKAGITALGGAVPACQGGFGQTRRPPKRPNLSFSASSRQVLAIYDQVLPQNAPDCILGPCARNGSSPPPLDWMPLPLFYIRSENSSVQGNCYSSHFIISDI